MVWLVTYPFDVIKNTKYRQVHSNMLVMGHGGYRGVAEHHYLTAARVFNAVVFASFGSFTRLVGEHTIEMNKKTSFQR